MGQKKAFEFHLGVKTPVSLKYNEPKTGQGQYGTWYMYSAIIDGEDNIFFAPEPLHREIQNRKIQPNQIFYITKEAVEKLGADGKMRTVNIHSLSTDCSAPVNSFVKSLDESKAIEAKKKEDEKWDDIARGKTRCVVCLEYIKKDRQLCSKLSQEIEEWVEYIMTGKIKEDDDIDPSQIPF